jgi:hypothetical protein
VADYLDIQCCLDIQKSIVLFEGSQALPACPGKSSLKMKVIMNQ